MYDINAAIKAGVDPTEIAQVLAEKHNYNLDGATKAGVPLEESINALLQKENKIEKISPVESRRESIKAITETPGYVPTGAERELTDEEITQQLKISDLVMRPLEFATAVPAGFGEAYWAGKKAQQTGKGPLEQLSTMWEAGKRPSQEYTRPLGEERTPVVTAAEVGGIKNPYLGLAANVVLDPSNIFYSSAMKKTIEGISGAAKIREGMKTAENVKDLSLFGGPIHLGQEEYLWRHGEVGKKYLPAVIEKPIVTTPFKLEKIVSKPEDIFPLGRMREVIGKDLKIIKGESETGQIWNVVDDKNNTYGKLKISEFPDEKRLHVDFIELSKNPIKKQIKKQIKNYEMLQEVKKLPDVYSSASKNIENYARRNGFEIITSDPFNMKRSKAMGFRPPPEGSDFLAWKRVNQKVDPKIIAESGPLKELDGFADRRQLFFDQPKPGSYAFYNKEGFEIYRTKDIKEAKGFIRNYPLPELTAKKADQLYNSIIIKIQENSRTQEVLNKYKIENISPTTYRKFLAEDTQKIAAETRYMKGEDLINSKINNPPPGTTVYSVGEIIKQRKEGMVPIHEGEFEALQNIKEPKLEWITGKGWLEPSQFTFEKAGQEAKELFLYPVNIGRKNSVVERANIMTEFKNTFKELKNNNWNRIGIYMESLDPIGSKTLERMLSKGKIKGIPTLDELNVIEQKAVSWFNGKYGEFIGRVNESRILAGLKPIAPRENYHPLFRDLNTLDSLGYNVFHKDLDNTISQFIHRYSTYFRHEIERKGGIIPIEINAAKAFEMYLGSAMKHIHLTPPIAKGRELLKTMPGKWLLQDEKPTFYSFITKWLDGVAGQKAITEMPGWMDKVLGKLNKNITFAMLSYNVRSASIQPTSLLNTISEVGAWDAREGLVYYLKGGGKEALQKSNVLAQRIFEESVGRAMQGVTGKIGAVQKTVAKAGMKPLQLLDMETAKASWCMAYKKAIRKGKNGLGLAEREAINHADDVVIKTQASGNIENLSPLQRTAMGRTVSLFQTFVLNNWAFLTRDVAGIGKNVSKAETFKKVATYLTGATALNVLFEDVLGTYSPFPTPIKSFTKALDEGEDIPTASLRAAKEISELIPIIGGGLKYGSSPVGAAAELVTGITGKASGKPILRTWEDMLASLAGIPGTAQAKKIIKGVSADINPAQILLGAAGKYEREGGKITKTKHPRKVR